VLVIEMAPVSLRNVTAGLLSYIISKLYVCQVDSAIISYMFSNERCPGSAIRECALLPTLVIISSGERCTDSPLGLFMARMLVLDAVCALTYYHRS